MARAIDPQLSSYLSAQLRHGAIVITGTNGKTTTSGLVGCVLREGGLRVWRNREGSNLARGVATALLNRASAAGAYENDGDAAFVFEVDEAAFPKVVADLKPRVIVITNLFRDQLDRYGEVDLVAERWRDSLKTLPPSTTLALNADDPAVAALADSFAGKVIYFGVEDAPDISEHTERVQTIDTRTCPRCRGMLIYSRRFYSHVGHWACSQCDFARPQPAVSARVDLAGESGSNALRSGAAGWIGACDRRAARPLQRVQRARRRRRWTGFFCASRTRYVRASPASARRSDAPSASRSTGASATSCWRRTLLASTRCCAR